MKLSAVWLLPIALFGAAAAAYFFYRPSEASSNREAREEAAVLIDWPPAIWTKHQNAPATPAQEELRSYVEVSATGTTVLGSDGKWWPLQAEYVATGSISTTLGQTSKTATVDGIAYLTKAGSSGEHAAWGLRVVEGQMILPKSVFDDPPEQVTAGDNHAAVEGFDENHVLVTVHREKGHQITVLERGNSHTTTVGFVGSRLDLENGETVERRQDGWYQLR